MKSQNKGKIEIPNLTTHLRTSTYIYLHHPTSSYICLHLPTSTCTYLLAYLPTYPPVTYLPCCHYLSVFSPCYDLINLPTYSSMTCVPSWRSVVTSLLDILIRLPGITHSCFIHVSICDLTYLHNYQSTTRVPPIVFFTFSGMQGRHFFVKLFLFISWMQNRTYLHSPPTMKQHKTLVGH